MKASHLLTQEEQNIVVQALQEAEKSTSGEIVPVIATDSGRYDRSEDIFGVFFSLILVSLFWLFFQGLSGGSEGDWTGSLSIQFGLFSILGVFVIGFIVGATLATFIPSLKMPFILNSEIDDEVSRRAAECFYRYGIRKTTNSTGVLIYISLLEHRVIVEGDEAISQKLNQDDWEHVCQTIVEGMKNNNPAEGLQKGIEQIGQLLSQHFPSESDDKNELENKIYFID